MLGFDNVFIIHTPSERYFCKKADNWSDIKNEYLGYYKLSKHFRVPKLFSMAKYENDFVLIYEYLNYIGKNTGLFLDLINSAEDKGHNHIEKFMHNMIETHSSVIRKTLKNRSHKVIVHHLFRDRLERDGRVDEFYGNIGLRRLKLGNKQIRISDLNMYRFIINGVVHEFNFDEVISKMQRYFLGKKRFLSILSNGDPTLMNITQKNVMLDFKNSGYNSVFGDFAIFIWDVFVIGAYIGPKYDSLKFKNHDKTFRYIKSNTPSLEKVKVDTKSRTIVINYKDGASRLRREIIRDYYNHLIVPVLKANNGEDNTKEFLYHLSMRIIGVLNIFLFEEDDIIYLLAKLIEAQDAYNFGFEKFFGFDSLDLKS